MISRSQSSQSGKLLSCEQTRHTERLTIANDPGNLHDMSNHTKNDTKSAQRPPHHRQRSGQPSRHEQPRQERHPERTTTATPSPTIRPTLHAMSHHAKNDTQSAHTDRFREADGRTIVPGWNASRPEPCAHGASRTPSPDRVCVRIYLQVLPYLLSTNGFQCGGSCRVR